MSTPAFQQLQRQFSGHIRDPQNNPAPQGIEPRRMNLYRELIYNNIESFLANGFPVLRSLLDDTAWQQLVSDFLAYHKSQTPYFLEITQELLQYLQEERQPQAGDFPFMLELAHYEWLELAADVDPDTIPSTGFNPDGNLLHGKPVLSPLVYVAAYDYPVHKIGVDNIPQSPGEQPTYLIVYRNREDRVGFMEINAVTARLLQLLQERPHATGRQVIEWIQSELQHPDPEVVMNGGLQALQELQAVGVVLGTELKPL